MISERPPIFRLLLLAALLGSGLYIVLLSVWLGCGYRMIGSFIQDKHKYEGFAVLADGTAVIVSSAHPGDDQPEARTLEGKPVSPKRLDKAHRVGVLAGLKPAAWQYDGRDWSNRIARFGLNPNPANLWYFIHTGRKEGQGYFEGFDRKTKLRLGYIGRNGPMPTKPAPEECFALDGRQLKGSGRFVSTGARYGSGIMSVRVSAPDGSPLNGVGPTTMPPLPPWKSYLVCGDELLEVDLETPDVRVLGKFDEPFSVAGCWGATDAEEETNSSVKPHGPNYLGVRTHDRITLVETGTNARKVYQIPPEVGDGRFSLYEFDDGTAMLTVARAPGDGVRPMDLYWLDDTGKPVRDAHLELAWGAPSDARLGIAMGGAVMPALGPWCVVSFVAGPWHYIFSGQDPGYWAALARSLEQSWPALLVSLLITAPAVWWCIRRQRQYAAGWTRTWVAFIFVFGLPAFLGYLLHRAWPVRIECPACGKPAPHDRLSCSVCDVDFPEPASEGIEVFA